MSLAIVTGFEPFSGLPSNSSETLLQGLPQSLHGVKVETAVLPVDTHAVGDVLREIYAWSPSVLVHLGLAVSRDSISLERVARNHRSFSVSDNAGIVVRDTPVMENGPEQLPSRLPLERLFRAVEAADAPVELSSSAGAYLCNQVMYTSLLATDPHVVTGFIHVPPDETLAGRLGRRGLSMNSQRRALNAILEVLLASDPSTPGTEAGSTPSPRGSRSNPR